MGPVGFEPTTASAPGQYLDEINSNQSSWYPSKLDDGPLRLRQMESFLNVVLSRFQHEINYTLV
jgi:hypothetical protein